MTERYAGSFPADFLRADGHRTATPNERLVMTILSKRGAASRADLARATALAPHSIGRLIEPLSERGLIVEGAPEIAGRGKPSTRLRLSGEAAFSVGVSVMTDAITLVLMDLAGEVRARSSAALDRAGLMTGAEQITAMIAAAATTANLDPALQVGIGIGVTGYFIGDDARLNPPDQLGSWALLPLDTMLADRIGAPVWVDNDGNVAAVGEAMLGAGRACSSFAYLYFAAGFGGGVVADGRPLRGCRGNAGEFAAILPTDWMQPNLESLRRHLADHGRSFADIRDMLDRFDPGAAAVDAWLDRCAPSLNLVASAISATLDPDAIVLGGRLPVALADRMADRIRFTNPERRGHSRPTPRIISSAMGSDAAAIGAAMLPLRAAFFE